MFEWLFNRKIELFVRHCNFSEVSQHKNRLPGFSREKCHENLRATLDNRVNVTFLLDTFHPSKRPHFVQLQKEHRVIEIKEGTEAGSFLKLLDHVESLKLPDETSVYFLEDDYLHKAGWIDILLEGLALPEASYVTLFDHRDKYFSYPDLHSRVFHTKSCHWRTTPSTTNTYAMKAKTLKNHLSVHREYSEGRKISADHEKFQALAKMGATLISPMPGWSTHVEAEYASPCINWELLLQN
jgi:hypothetical protein